MERKRDFPQGCEGTQAKAKRRRPDTFERIAKEREEREESERVSSDQDSADEPEGRVFTSSDRDKLSKKISELPPYRDTTAYFNDRYDPKVRDIDPKLDVKAIHYMDNQNNKYGHVALRVNGQGCYSIYVNLKDAHVIVDDVHSDEDKAIKEGDPLPFSELEWHCFRLVAGHKYKPEDVASELSAFYKHPEIKITHIDVSNSDTVATAYYYTTNGNPKVIEGVDDIKDLREVNIDNQQSFRKESDACGGLLAAPNGRSIPYLFEQHKGSFGSRETEMIVVQLRETYESKNTRDWEYVDRIDFIVR